MKAVVLRENQHIQLENLPIPSLSYDECQIKVSAVGVCSSDISRSFDHGAYFYPLIMGHEFSGEIVQVGSSVKDKFKVGDRVAVYPLIPCRECEYCSAKSYVYCKNYDYYGSRRHGAFAEYLNVNVWNLIPIPDTVSLEKAAALEPLSVCIHALRRCGLFNLNFENVNYNNINVAIIGAGFLGLLTARILNWICPNLEVTLIDRNNFKLERNATCTSHKNICLEKQTDWLEFVEDSSNRFSYVIESCGVPDTFRYSIQLAKHNGSVVWIGNISDNLQIPKTMVSSILRKELNIIGTWNSNYDPSSSNDWTTAIDLLSRGFEFESLISERISLNDLPMRMLKLHLHKSRKSDYQVIKLVVIPSLK